MKKSIYQKIDSAVRSIEKKRCLAGKYSVINRSKSHENLLYILAGYKPELWDNVFERICRENLENFDVCIISSGCYEPKLKDIADKKRWSYIWSKNNYVSNIQNFTITQFPKAKKIWKLDEDMFTCRNYFMIMEETKKKAEKELDYEIGFLGPLIPINSYGYIRFLRHCNKLQEYEQRFGIAKVGFEEEKAINLHSFGANKYLWELTGNIDEKAKEFNLGNLNYSVCSGRFSIGAIMFDRNLWIDMGGFKKDHYRCDGRDEIEILKYCAVHSKAIVVAEDALVGHYSFGGIYHELKRYMNSVKYKYF